MITTTRGIHSDSIVRAERVYVLASVDTLASPSESGDQLDAPTEHSWPRLNSFHEEMFLHQDFCI